MKQYNGYNACAWCHHPGECVRSDDGVQVRYTVTEEFPYPNRKDTDFIDDAATAVTTHQPVRGIFGPTPLTNIPSFSIPKHISIDYMHCALLGVVRTLLQLWLISDREAEYHLSSHKQFQIDNKLRSFKLTQQFSRNPVTLKMWKQWKASEWRIWLLFYGPIVLKNVLHINYFKHFCLFSEIIFTLTKDSISPTDLRNAHAMCFEFVRKYQNLYGSERMTYNVHICSHLAEMVQNWGPLWATSCFNFEHGIGLLKKLVSGTKMINVVLANKYLLYSSIPVFYQEYAANASRAVSEYITKLTGYELARSACQVGEVVFLGCGQNRVLDAYEIMAMRESNIENVVPHQMTFYSRCIFNGIKYHSKEYMRATSTYDCLVELANRQHAHIVNIASYNGNNFVFLKKMMPLANTFVNFGIYVNDEQVRCRMHHITQYSAEDILSVVHVEDIIKKCIFLNEGENLYACCIPNRWETD